MPEEPRITGLSYRKRKYLFFFLLAVFVIALPSLILYTSGYRLDFANEEKTLVSTGGIYITTDNLEVQVYMDGEQVDRPRLFRNAYYIQNISAGLHNVVVQGTGLATWVKELPVDSHLVIETSAFNMPEFPLVRPITEYVTADGTAVYPETAKELLLFSEATTTTEFIFAPKADFSRLAPNQEFVYVKSLFSTATTASSTVLKETEGRINGFGFASGSTTGLDLIGTSSKKIERGNLQLVERDGEIFARWVGSGRSIPYYFCINEISASTTAFRYGQHVAQSIEQQRQSTTTPLIIEYGRVCRSEIRVDRKWQTVYFYDFFPQNSDLVLLQLDDGLYVTEIDDRSWQNTQLIYPGKDFEVVVENEALYVKDGDYYFEVLTGVEG